MSSTFTTRLVEILGLDRVYNMIIVGAGNLGQALANYVKFEKRGFWIKGIFDVNPRLKGMTVRGIEIRMTDELPQFIRDNQIQIAALTLPKSGAEELAPILVEQWCKGDLELCTYRSAAAAEGRDRGERSSFGEPDAAFLQFKSHGAGKRTRTMRQSEAEVRHGSWSTQPFPFYLGGMELWSIW